MYGGEKKHDEVLEATGCRARRRTRRRVDARNFFSAGVSGFQSPEYDAHAEAFHRADTETGGRRTYISNVFGERYIHMERWRAAKRHRAALQTYILPAWGAAVGIKWRKRSAGGVESATLWAIFRKVEDPRWRDERRADTALPVGVTGEERAMR
ncbi:hypothetical protein K438DRAFT_1773182 [Mycena galopus ATCC 62051]|nr:hypothetical protein K438DRAFT_1773182 [Mycena galopus ATCC 62051]